MFTWLNKQGVQSNKGFSVQRTGRFTAKYQEGSRKISVNLENDILPDGGFCEVIDADSFSKWDDGVVISKQNQVEILKNFTEAMEFQDIGIIVK